MSNICYKKFKKKGPNSHVCQSVKASEELVEGSDQILGREVHGQQSEAFDVCKKDAAKRTERVVKVVVC